MPHILRHAGASNDAFRKRRSLADIQKRGRWEAKKSVSRYEKHALLLKRWEQADSGRKQTIRARSGAATTFVVSAATAVENHRKDRNGKYAKNSRGASVGYMLTNDARLFT